MSCVTPSRNPSAVNTVTGYLATMPMSRCVFVFIGVSIMIPPMGWGNGLLWRSNRLKRRQQRVHAFHPPGGCAVLISRLDNECNIYTRFRLPNSGARQARNVRFQAASLPILRLDRTSAGEDHHPLRSHRRLRQSLPEQYEGRCECPWLL